MKPMTKTEISIWDAIAIAEMTPIALQDGGASSLQPEKAYAFATSAIAARRAALIADAGPGVNDAKYGGWICHCESHDKRSARIEYCESCHTRRPDADDKVAIDKQDCSTCKHHGTPKHREPCKTCVDYRTSDNCWEAAT